MATHHKRSRGLDKPHAATSAAAFRKGEPHYQALSPKISEAQRIALSLLEGRVKPEPRPITIRKFSWQTDEK
jgi:hypothetical protein